MQVIYDCPACGAITTWGGTHPEQDPPEACFTCNTAITCSDTLQPVSDGWRIRCLLVRIEQLELHISDMLREQYSRHSNAPITQTLSSKVIEACDTNGQTKKPSNCKYSGDEVL